MNFMESPLRLNQPLNARLQVLFCANEHSWVTPSPQYFAKGVWNINQGINRQQLVRLQSALIQTRVALPSLTSFADAKELRLSDGWPAREGNTLLNRLVSHSPPTQRPRRASPYPSYVPPQCNKWPWP